LLAAVTLKGDAQAGVEAGAGDHLCALRRYALQLTGAVRIAKATRDDFQCAVATKPLRHLVYNFAGEFIRPIGRGRFPGSLGHWCTLWLGLGRAAVSQPPKRGRCRSAAHNAPGGPVGFRLSAALLFSARSGALEFDHPVFREPLQLRRGQVSPDFAGFLFHRSCLRSDYYVRHYSMMVKKIVGQNKRRVGRPVTVDAEEKVTLRLPKDLLRVIDRWAKASEMNRSEAIRELVEMSLEKMKE
jgi:hypothetical protein